MLLERVVTRVLIFTFLMTLTSLLFHEFFQTASDNYHGKALSKENKFILLNKTLTQLKEDLQIIYKDHLTSMKPVELPTDVSHLVRSVADASETNETTIPIDYIKEGKKSAATPSRIQIPERRALLYTMDSISTYELASKQGGAAGELLIRHSLATIFKELGVHLDVKDTDEGFESADTSSYDIIIVDPWTWAAKGWVPKNHLIGMDSKIYVLDFFGSKKIRGTGLNIPVDRFLTAYKTNSYNSFLGYFIDETNMRNSSHIEVRNSSEKYKKNQGIIWGKDPKHFDGKIEIIKSVANKVLLLTTASINIFEHSNIVWLGHQETNHWLELLSQSKFLLGMGDPLLGPSAVDAISRGCMFLNPMYDKPVIVNDQMFQSQHPYAAENIGEPYVCSYKINDILSLEKCIEKALRTTLKPYVPKHFTKEAYRQRVIDIFRL